MDQAERLAIARRAFVAWGLESKRSTEERRAEAKEAGEALVAAMRSAGAPTEIIAAETVAAWVGLPVEDFVEDVAEELVAQDIAHDTPIEREVRDALDVAEWRRMQDA
jgi:hypothetical protein